MVSAIELGESLSKLMIPIPLFEKYGSETFIRSIKVIYMTTHSSNSYKLKNLHPVRGTTWNVTIQKGENLLYQNHRVYDKLWRKQTVNSR